MDTQKINDAAEKVTNVVSKFTTNALVVGVVGVVLLYGGFKFVTGYADYKAAIAVAEIKEEEAKEKEKLVLEHSAVNQKLLAALNEETAKREELLKQLSSQQNELHKLRDQRAIETAKRVEEVISPVRQVPEVVKDVDKYMHMVVTPTATGIEFTKEDTQKVVVQSIQLVRLEADLKALQQDLTLEQSKTQQLTELLGQTRTVLDESKQLLDDYKLVMEAYKTALDKYKVAAKKSKWQHVKDFGWKAVEIAVTAVIIATAVK
jgi:DNA repair exonuclease SbcCD ATPase subunit